MYSLTSTLSSTCWVEGVLKTSSNSTSLVAKDIGIGVVSNSLVCTYSSTSWVSSNWGLVVCSVILEGVISQKPALISFVSTSWPSCSKNSIVRSTVCGLWTWSWLAKWFNTSTWGWLLTTPISTIKWKKLRIDCSFSNWSNSPKKLRSTMLRSRGTVIVSLVGSRVMLRVLGMSCLSKLCSFKFSSKSWIPSSFSAVMNGTDLI